jgi:hypothetical protein
VFRRGRSDVDGFDGAYYVDDPYDSDDSYDFDDPYDEGSPGRLASVARRAVKVGVAAGAASCLIVLGLWVLDLVAGDGIKVPVAAGSERPTPAASTVDASPRSPAQTAAEPGAAPSEPARVEPSDVISASPPAVGHESAAPPEPYVPTRQGDSSRHPSPTATTTQAASSPTTPTAPATPRPASTPQGSPVASPPAVIPASPPPTPAHATGTPTPTVPASNATAPPRAVGQAGPPPTVPPAMPPVTAPPTTPPPVAVPAASAHAGPSESPDLPGKSDDHRRDDGRGRGNAPGQSAQHGGIVADDDGGKDAPEAADAERTDGQ